MPRFSIIIPVYNVERYLEECLLSVVGQTYKDFEIILVDDGSPDSCPEICDEWAKKDSRVKVIHKENGGLSDARNKGIDIACGDYILFLDSDDFWKDGSVLLAISDRVLETDPDVISFNYHKTDGSTDSCQYFGNKTNMPVDLKGRESLAYQMENDLWIASSWNKCIKRELFECQRLRFVEGIPFEDIDWCVRLALICENFDYICNDVVCYRQRPGSISQSPTAEKIEILVNNTDRCVDILNAAEDEKKAELVKPYMGYQCATLIFTVSKIDDKDQRHELLEKVRRFIPMLSYSKNKKVRLVRAVSSLVGIKGASFLMHFLFKIKHR